MTTRGEKAASATGAVEATTAAPTRPPSREQVRYARQRLEALLEVKVSEVRLLAHETLCEPQDARAKMELILAGDAGEQRVPDVPIEEPEYGWQRWEGPRLIECYDWPDDRATRRHNEAVRTAARTEEEALRREVQGMVDRLVLGDAAQVLAQLTEFEARPVVLALPGVES